MQITLEKSMKSKEATTGKSAGPRRNRAMADYAEALIALPDGGPGTANMIAEAHKRGLLVHIQNL